jgi:cytochrome c biogenesis protein CcdA
MKKTFLSMILYFLALLAGLLSITTPSTVFLLPGIIASGGLRLRHEFVVLGFIISFALAQTLANAQGFNMDLLRSLGVGALVVYGLSFIYPQKAQLLLAKQFPKINIFEHIGSALAVGVIHGLIWMPPAGPMLGMVIALAQHNRNLLVSFILFAVYAAGAGLPMLAIAHLGHNKFNAWKNTPRHDHALRIVGFIILLAAVLIATGVDAIFQTVMISSYPSGIMPL